MSDFPILPLRARMVLLLEGATLSFKGTDLEVRPAWSTSLIGPTLMIFYFYVNIVAVHGEVRRRF